MTLFFRCLSVLVCLISVVSAVEITPGMNKDLPTANPAWTWWAYVPKAHSEGTQSLPALYIHSPGGKPGSWKLEAWAERRGVYLIGLNNTANGVPWPTMDQIQAAVLTASEQHLRVHPNLRYSTGQSGGAWCSVRIAKANPEKFAGVLLMVHSGNGDYAPKHCAIGFWAGTKDDVHGIGAVRGAIATYKGNGNPLMVEIRDGGHGDMPPLAWLERCMDWMLLYTCATHPHLSAADRSAGLARLEAACAEAAAVSAPAARAEACVDLLGIAPIAASRPGVALRETWIASVLEAAAADATDLERHDRLVAASEHDAFAKVPAKLRSDIGKQLTALRKDSPVKEEWQATQMLRHIQAAETKAGRAKGALMDVAKGYHQLAQRLPDTRAGKQAATEAQRLATELAK